MLLNLYCYYITIFTLEISFTKYPESYCYLAAKIIQIPHSDHK